MLIARKCKRRGKSKKNRRDGAYRREVKRRNVSRDELVQSLEDVRDIFSFESFPRCYRTTCRCHRTCYIRQPLPSLRPFRGTKRNRITSGRSVYDRFDSFFRGQYDQRFVANWSFLRQIVSSKFLLEDIIYFSKNKNCPKQSPSFRIPLPLGGGNFRLRRINYSRIKRTFGGVKRHNDWHSRTNGHLSLVDRREPLPEKPSNRDTRWRALLLGPLGSWQIGQESFSEIVGLESTPIPPRSFGYVAFCIRPSITSNIFLEVERRATSDELLSSKRRFLAKSS